MAGPEAGEPVGVDALGPLARMWRSVYRKAAEVAEGRARELVRDHVYQYPHGAGGAPAGGGLAELGRAVAAGGPLDLRVPASGHLPTGYSALWLIGTGFNNSATATQQSDVYLFFNDDVDYSTYYYRNVLGTATGSVVTGTSTASAAIHLGLAPALNPAAPPAVWSASGVLPQHESTALPKTGQFLSTQHRTATAHTLITTSMVYAPSPGAAITSVHLRCLDNWRTGATFVVYGAPNA